MRISAAKVIGQKILYKKINDPLAGGPKRISKFAEIEDNAMEFINEVLMDFDLPSTPQITLGAAKGFTDVNTDFTRVSGVIPVYASFRSLSGVQVRFELPIPICRGEFHRPSIIIVNGKKHVLSQQLIDTMVKRTENIVPTITNEFSPKKNIIHLQNIKKEMFGMPDPLGLYWDPSFT